MSQPEVKSVTIVTHAWCPDGLFAAYIVARKLAQNSPTVIPVAAGKSYSVPESGPIIFVDMCPDAEMADAIIGRGQHLTVIDHHVTNEKQIARIAAQKNTITLYATDACASILASRMFGLNDSKLENILKYVDDRDRWVYESGNAHPNSEEMCAAIHFYNTILGPKMTQDEIKSAFATVDKILAFNPEELLRKGIVLHAQTRNLVTMLANTAKKGTFMGKYKVAVCETRIFRSEVGNVLLSYDVDFSICWSYQIDERVYWLALRSNNKKTDVSEVAKLLGGGGHRNAAGCDAKDFTTLFTADPDNAVDCAAALMNIPDPDDAVVLYEQQCRNISSIAGGAKPCMIDNKTAVAVETQLYSMEVADYLLAKNDVVVIWMYDPVSKNYPIIVKSNKYDMAALVKPFGGDGSVRVAACRVPALSAILVPIVK